MNKVAGQRAVFSPLIPPATSSTRAELLGRFVPTAIERIPPIGWVNKPVRVAILGLLTVGYLPLLQIRTRLHRLLPLDRQHLELIGETLQSKNGSTKADLAIENASRVSPVPWLGWLGDLLMIGSLLCAIFSLSQSHWTPEAIRRFYLHPPAASDASAVASLLLLCAAYILTFLQINRHLAAFGSFANAFNTATAGNVPPITIPRRAWGFRPAYVILAIVLTLLGKLWAFPMMLAWGALHTFLLDSQRRLRSEIADRLTTLSGVAPVIDKAAICRNIDCGTSIEDDAAVCPACGEPVTMR